MLFNSIHFLFFFPIVALIYFVLPFRFRWVWLLFASYYFYMSWNPVYALLIAFSTVITFLSGILIDRAGRMPDEKRRRFYRKLWVALSFIINFSILFFFKYFNFALGNLNRLLAVVGIQALTPAFDVLLPVGISFYTFQALSYTMDVYRGEVVEKNLGKYALFVSFFPQLVAGPIERSKNLLDQIHENHPLDYEKVRRGLVIMLWGYFEKMVIADRAALAVNVVFGEFEQFAGMQVVSAVLLFAVQIYGDFSGYSHIAIGAALVMGFDLMQNFRQPYLATSIRDFWQRWHISLSTWFRDYLYIPLGGNRKGRLRKYFNTMVTFLLSGLWHGASWTYVAWGGLHGAYQVAADLLAPAKKRLYGRLGINKNAFLPRLLRMVVTFVLVDFAWILFRAPGMRAFFSIVGSMFRLGAPQSLQLSALGLAPREWVVLLAAIVILAVVDGISEKRDAVALLQRQHTVVRWVVYYLLLYIVLRYGVFGTGYVAPDFIYFQF